jgi:hypothetical protein
VAGIVFVVWWACIKQKPIQESHEAPVPEPEPSERQASLPQLPADLADFTGPQEEVRELLAALGGELD